jgi:hypothetical protein
VSTHLLLPTTVQELASSPSFRTAGVGRQRGADSVNRALPRDPIEHSA